MKSFLLFISVFAFAAGPNTNTMRGPQFPQNQPNMPPPPQAQDSFEEAEITTPSAVNPSKHQGVKLPDLKPEPQTRKRNFEEILQDKEFDKIWDLPYPDAIVESFDWPDAEIRDIIKSISKLTRKNFILEPKISGKITIITQAPIKVRDAFKVFLTSLFANGWSIIQTGEYLRVVKLSDAREMKHPIIEGEAIPDADSMITKVLPLKYVDSDEVIRNIRTLTNREARVFSLQQANTLIIVETASNMQRLLKIIALLDQQRHLEEPEIVHVKYAQASEIEKMLKNIIDDANKNNPNNRRNSSPVPGTPTGPSIGPKIKDIIADDRTNNLIILANQEGLDRVKKILVKIDIPAESTGGKIHVYPLVNSDAKKLSESLNKLLSNLQDASKQQGGANGTRPVIRRPFEPDATTPGNEDITGNVKIAPDEDTNSLIITATPADYNVVKDVIEKLDIARDQVFVEAVVLEMVLDNGFNYGMNYVGPTAGIGEFNRTGFMPNGGDLATMLTNPTGLGAFFLGFSEFGQAKEIKVGDKTITVKGLNGFIKAVQTVTDANIRATPSLMTLDNQEASIKVVEKIPTEKTVVTTTGSQSSIETTDVGLNMKITPNINKVSKVVKLKIEFQLDDFTERDLPANIKTKALATSSRTANTTINVPDSETVVIGGLIRERVNKTRTQIPLLGDIPLIGWLFRSYNYGNTKTNLIVFMTPKVVKHRDNLSEIRNQQLMRRDEFISEHRGGEEPFPKIRQDLGGQTSAPDAAKDFSSNQPTKAETAKKEDVKEVPAQEMNPPAGQNSQNAVNDNELESVDQSIENNNVAPSDEAIPEF